MAIQSFKEIIAWQKAHEFALLVYKITNDFPKQEIFNLISQIRRCAVSIPSNIAGGFARKSLNDSKRFYLIAEASLEELKYQLLLSKDLGYITEIIYNEILEKSDEVGKLLNSWKKSQKY